MKKTPFATAGATIGVASIMAVALAPASSAGTPEPIQGNASVVPLTIVNASDNNQTMSITINPQLTYQVQVYAPGQELTYGCNTGVGSEGNGVENRDNNGYGSSGFSQDFVVDAGTVQVFTLCVGGQGEMGAGTDLTFSIGGLPNGASNAQWYDFDVNLNLDQDLTSLQPYYSGTGGLDQATNTQNGFNILQCNPDTTLSADQSWQTVKATPTIVSPYSASTYYPQNYGWGAPVCMGWLPEGYMQPTSDVTIDNSANGPIDQTLAIQTVGSNTSYVSAVFSTTDTVTWVGYGAAGSGTIPSGPSPSGWWTQLSNGDLVIESVPYQGNGTYFTVTSKTGSTNVYPGNYVAPPPPPVEGTQSGDIVSVNVTQGSSAWAGFMPSTTVQGAIAANGEIQVNLNPDIPTPTGNFSLLNEIGINPYDYADNIIQWAQQIMLISATGPDGTNLNPYYPDPQGVFIGESGDIQLILPTEALDGPYEVTLTYGAPETNSTWTDTVTLTITS